jgi:predicted peptidase
MTVARRQFLTSALALAAGTSTSSIAQPATNSIDRFVDARFTGDDADPLDYRLFTPTLAGKNGRAALIIWLHGGNADGTGQQRPGPKPTATYQALASPERQSILPAFVLAPLSPESPWYRPGTPSLSSPLYTVMLIVAKLKKTVAVDPTRIVVMGVSAGGFATWDLIAKRPGEFAAAVPICGGGEVSRARKVAQTPVWAFHGDADNVVPVEESRQMVTAVKRVGGSVRYTEFAGVGHHCWPQVFAEQTLWPWLATQRTT